MLNRKKIEIKERILNNKINYYNITFDNIKDTLKKRSLILNLSFLEEDLIKRINSYLDNECDIVNFFDNLENSIDLKLRFFNDKNIIFNKMDLNNNYLKNNSVDIILGQNILNNKKKLLEIKRVLKEDGKFIFSEIVSLKPLKSNFQNYFLKHNKSIFKNIVFDISSKIKFFSSNYEIKTISNGLFYLNENEIKELQDFCDISGFTAQDRNSMLSEIFLVLIKGNISKN